MNFKPASGVVACFVLGALLAASSAAANTMTNSDVVNLSKAGLPESTIALAVEKAAEVRFDVSPEALIAMKNSGVTPKVIEAVIARQSVPVPAAPVTPRASDGPTAGPAAPTEDEVASLLRARAAQTSGGVIVVEAFRKTNGQRGVRDGAPQYKMDFEMTIRFTRGCIWRNINVDETLQFNVAELPRGEGMDAMLHAATNPGVQFRANALVLVNGTVSLTKTENGWVEEFAQFRKLTETSSPQLAEAPQSDPAPPPPVPKLGFLSPDAVRQMLAAPASGAKPGDVAKQWSNHATVLPANFIKRESPDGAVFFIPSPGDDRTNAIMTACSPLGFAGRNLTTDRCAMQFKASFPKEMPGAKLTAELPTTLAGSDARLLCYAVVEDGISKYFFEIFAVTNKRQLRAELRVTAEKLDEYWPIFRQVCDSFAVVK
jgi:hypothetical protein